MGRILLAIAVLSSLAGCSSPPSTGGGKKALVAYLSQHYPGANVAVTGFEKTGGHQQKVKDIAGYVMSFNATTEFADGYRIDCDRAERIPAYFDCPTLGPIGAGAPVPVGTGLRLAGTVELQKLEKGWKAVAVKISDAKPFDMVATNDYYLKKPCTLLADPNVESSVQATYGDRQKNKVIIGPSGMTWNNVPVKDDEQFRQFLENTLQMNPPPILHVLVKKGTPLPKVQREWRVIRWSGVCEWGLVQPS